jgi:hypothetical protein
MTVAEGPRGRGVGETGRKQNGGIVYSSGPTGSLTNASENRPNQKLMATAGTVAGSRAEHRGLTYWMERTLKELEKVRETPDADAVHDLRVAIRRCRSVAAVMQEVDPDPA